MRFFTNDVDECFSHHGINQVRCMTAGNYFSSCGNGLVSPPWGIYNETRKHILSYQKLGPSAFCAVEGGQEAGLPALTHAARKSQVVQLKQLFPGMTSLVTSGIHTCLLLSTTAACESLPASGSTNTQPCRWGGWEAPLTSSWARSPTESSSLSGGWTALDIKNYLCLTAWLRA